MTDHVEQRLERLGIILPQRSEPAANYSNYVKSHSYLFVSGKGPSGSPKGKLGQDYSTETGYHFARSAGIEVLAVIKEAMGRLDRVKRVVKIQGFVNATDFYEEHHLVLNGCSDLMCEVFGEQGIHSRSVMGANSLRGNLPVIVELIFEI